MRVFDFTLKFNLPDATMKPDAYTGQLSECDDALVGVGQNGRLALHFTREANSAIDAVFSAIKDVKKAIPEAELIEATPDLVGLSDIAEILGYSRQNIRKLMVNNRASFPVPVHEGKSAIWHLSSILAWFSHENRYAVDESLIDVAKANMQLNIAKEVSKLDPSLNAQIGAYL